MTKSLAEQLSEDAVGRFLAAEPASAIVDVSAAWCAPCRWLGPIVQKVAFELEIPLILVDGEAAPRLTKEYEIDSFPTLLFFRGGKLVERHCGFLQPEEMRKLAAQIFERTIQTEPTAAELAFQEAYRQADRRMTEIMQPPSDALEPHLAAIQPELSSIEASLQHEVGAGRISSGEAARRLTAERKRLYAPFQAQIRSLEAAQNEALAFYEAIMNAAVEAFTRQDVNAPGASQSERMCLPGDASCKVN